MTASRFGFAVVVLSLFASACTDTESATDLNPEGPPMIRQVRLKAVNTDANGSVSTRRVFAFGTHPLAATTDYPALGANSMVTIAATGQSMRIIMDELLVGNYLEEIACRGPLDAAGTAYDRVPLGATPDDIAKCASARDVLGTQCPGTMTHAVCLCKDDGGCGGADPMKTCGREQCKNDPVGVLDVNQDGAADDTRLIAGSVGIKCGAMDIPMDQNASYWNPSGDQNKPAMGGFDALGPALVLAPAAALPTNLDCLLNFAPNIVDKQGVQVCAPTNGDVEQNCTPGDVSAFKFKVEALRVTNQSFANNQMGVDRSAPVILVANAAIAPATVTAVTVTQNGAPFTGFTLSLPLPTSLKITWNPPGLAAMTTYVINVATTLTDTYGQPLPQMISYTFTTGM
jgi:hypothetical protein